MATYDKPTTTNEVFNVSDFDASLEQSLTVSEADALYIKRNNTDAVNVIMSWINNQKFYSGINLYNSDLVLKDEFAVNQLIIKQSGINDMTLQDINNCSFTTGHVQTQLTNNYDDIVLLKNKMSDEFATVVYVDDLNTLSNLKIDANTFILLNFLFLLLP